MRTLIALLALAGSALAQGITITTTVTIGQQNMLARIVERTNAEAVAQLVAQFPEAKLATNEVGVVRARMDGEVVGRTERPLRTVDSYAIELAEAAIKSTARQERDRIKAAVTAAYDAADAATQKAVESSLKVKAD